MSLQEPITGLWATAPARLPFDNSVLVRAFVLQRAQGNVIVYNAHHQYKSALIGNRDVLDPASPAGRGRLPQRYIWAEWADRGAWVGGSRRSAGGEMA